MLLGKHMDGSICYLVCLRSCLYVYTFMSSNIPAMKLMLPNPAKSRHMDQHLL